MTSVVTDQMRATIGIKSEPRKHIAEAGAIRRFAEATGDLSPRYRDGTVAPPTFLRSFDQVPPAPEFEIPYPDILDGGSNWEFFEAVRANDEITATTEVVGVSEKTGSLGAMLFVVREHRYVNQHGQTATVQKSTTIYYDGASPSPQPSPREEMGQVASLPTPESRVRNESLCIENVSTGDEILGLVKVPTARQLVQYAGASGDFYEIHYDQEYARSVGLPDVIVHGALKSAFLAQMLTDRIGERGVLRKLSVQYRGMDIVGSPIYCKGVVTRVPHPFDEIRTDSQEERGQDSGLVECSVWTEPEDGTKTTVGTANVTLSSRHDR